MITELPARFRILAMGTDYYDVDVLDGVISNHGNEWGGYTEQQMLNYINGGVWKITEVYEEIALKLGIEKSCDYFDFRMLKHFCRLACFSEAFDFARSIPRISVDTRRK